MVTSDFPDTVGRFLRDSGFAVSECVSGGLRILNTKGLSGKDVIIVPLPVANVSPEEAERAHEAAESCLEAISSHHHPAGYNHPSGQDIHGRYAEYGNYTSSRSSAYIIVAEDIWHSRGEMIRSRLLAQLGRFTSVFARNTEVRRIDKRTAADFLGRWHTYGDASCRYRYGLFTGDGTVVAVSCFSSPRTWDKGGSAIRSYEWVRYASLPGVRVAGGMGKMLKAFVREVHPDDIMSYADREWTDGSVYEKLHFVPEGLRPPVMFLIDRDTFVRSRMSGKHSPPAAQDTPPSGSGVGHFFHINLGSTKYRLKLTGY